MRCPSHAVHHCSFRRTPTKLIAASQRYTLQVRFQLERTREGMQRQLAHAEGSVGVLQARLGDAQSDAEALRQRVGLEQARVRGRAGQVGTCTLFWDGGGTVL